MDQVLDTRYVDEARQKNRPVQAGKYSEHKARLREIRLSVSPRIVFAGTRHGEKVVRHSVSM